MNKPPAATHLQLKDSDEIEVDFIDSAERNAILSSAQTILDMIEHDMTAGSECPQTYRDLLWPAVNKNNISEVSPQLRLVPLERLGVAQGKGGSKVMVGYFADGTRPTESKLWSTPMLIKVAEGPAKLTEEKRNADVVKQYAGNHFVIPFHIGDPALTHQTLWSRFMPNTTLWHDQKNYWLGVDDLRRVLQGKCTLEGVNAEKVINGAIALLRPLHSKNVRVALEGNINVVEHYQWYLRGILTEKLDWADSKHWSNAWKKVWGDHTQESTELFGRTWTNPFWVLEQLKVCPKQKLQLGVVHGDFHPRNVVLTGYGEPHIIDFGWSGDNRHIAQDFALLECNLRFFVQTPSIPFNDLLLIARWIDVGDDPPAALSSPAAAETVKLIGIVRNLAPKHFDSGTNWGMQYAVAVFLIGLGLFKHLHECENQVAGHLTVLSLADYIQKEIIGKTPVGATR